MLKKILSLALVLIMTSVSGAQVMAKALASTELYAELPNEMKIDADKADPEEIVTPYSVVTTIYKKGDWRVDFHTPDTGKPFPHLHFFKGDEHVYCLNLKTMRACDQKKSNWDKLPKTVYDKAMSHAKVRRTIKKHQPARYNQAVSIAAALKKAGTVTLAAILVAAAFVNMFTGPVDDVAAWGFLVYSLQ